MSPRNNSDVARRPKSQSPANRKPASNGGSFMFVVADTPDGFKTKENMNIVRKQAMGNYLSENGKGRKPRGSVAATQLDLGSQGGHDDIVQRSFVEETAKSSEGEVSIQRKQSSTAKPSRTIGREKRASGPGTQLVRHQPPGGPNVLADPLFYPPRNIELVYDLEIPGPFVSIGKALDPFRTMFQVVDPVVSVEELKFYCSRVFGTKAMGLYWIPLILTRPHTFLSTLCIASAHQDAFEEWQTESRSTTELRQEVISLINRNFCDTRSTIADHNMIALIQLITSEVIAREELTVGIHEQGLATMIEQRGGLNQLNLRLASTISWVTLEAAILQEAPPRAIYVEFCASHSHLEHIPITVPESPIYDPRKNLETIERADQCNERAKNLINDTREMINLFLKERKQEKKQGRPNSSKLETLCNRVASEKYYPSTSNRAANDILTTRDWKYEAIRITALIQATAILKRTPLSEAIKHAANNSKNLSLFTSPSAIRSDESLVSPMTNMRRDSLSSISPSLIPSPSYSSYTPFFPNPQRASIASASSSFSSDIRSRPSIVSSNSSSSSFSDINPYFPSFQPPQASFSRANLFQKPPLCTPTTLLASLKAAINKSNLSDCWADMAGVLLWIALTVGAASRKEDKVLKKWFSALAVRASIMLCFQHPEGIHITMLRMTAVIEGLSEEGNDKIVAVAKEGKRRKL